MAEDNKNSREKVSNFFRGLHDFGKKQIAPRVESAWKFSNAFLSGMMEEYKESAKARKAFDTYRKAAENQDKSVDKRMQQLRGMNAVIDNLEGMDVVIHGPDYVEIFGQRLEAGGRRVLTGYVIDLKNKRVTGYRA